MRESARREPTRSAPLPIGKDELGIRYNLDWRQGVLKLGPEAEYIKANPACLNSITDAALIVINASVLPGSTISGSGDRTVRVMFRRDNAIRSAGLRLFIDLTASVLPAIPGPRCTLGSRCYLTIRMWIG